MSGLSCFDCGGKRLNELILALIIRRQRGASCSNSLTIMTDTNPNLIVLFSKFENEVLAYNKQHVNGKFIDYSIYRRNLFIKEHLQISSQVVLECGDTFLQNRIFRCINRLQQVDKRRTAHFFIASQL